MNIFSYNLKHIFCIYLILTPRYIVAFIEGVTYSLLISYDFKSVHLGKFQFKFIKFPQSGNMA